MVVLSLMQGECLKSSIEFSETIYCLFASPYFAHQITLIVELNRQREYFNLSTSATASCDSLVLSHSPHPQLSVCSACSQIITFDGFKNFVTIRQARFCADIFVNRDWSVV